MSAMLVSTKRPGGAPEGVDVPDALGDRGREGEKSEICVCVYT
jgi:hypothetical protein